MACDAIDVLWSDPRADLEGFRKSERGQGFEFGSDVFSHFLKDCDFELLIRSHESCMVGFDWPFGVDGRLLMIFSCRNYCGMNNEGCVLMLSDDNERELITVR
jgi:hypothetical protein